MAKAAGQAHVAVGVAVFWDQEDPDDYGEDGYYARLDDEACRRCVVCGATTLGSSTCSADCYHAWTYDPAPDPFEFDRF